MARPFDPSTLALLDGDALVERDLLVIEFPGTGGASYGFWNDVFDASFSSFPGVVFTGAATLISITPATQTVENTVQTLTGTLSGLDTAALAGLWDIALHKAQVTIAKALYEPVGRTLVNVVTVFRGRIDRPELRETPEGGEGVAGASSPSIVSQLVVEFVSRAREMDRSGNRSRSFADQARDFAGDRGFEFTSKTGTAPIKWGAGQSSGAKRAGG